VTVAAVREGALARLRGEHPAELGFLDAFARAVPDDTIVCADMCIPGYWLGALHRFPAPRRLVRVTTPGIVRYMKPGATGNSFPPAGNPLLQPHSLFWQRGLD
jgi:acetolactate synthase-1/2/3 large subunit